MSRNKPAGVLVFPGSNCDQDCVEALTTQAGISVQPLWYAEPFDETAFSLVVLPGGFSYGDYLRSGAIGALAPSMASVKRFAEAGRPVVGICNGFQVLTEAGLLPGALMRNSSLQFVCQQRCGLIVEQTRTPFTQGYTAGQVVEFPIAHGDGNFQVDADTLKRLQDQQQIVLRYTQEVNGSVERIAGICNVQGNVLGLMPHPERNLVERAGLGWTGEGAAFFQCLQALCA